MEDKKDFVVIIDKDTKLGKKEFVHGAISGIISALVCNTDGVTPQEVCSKAIVETKSHTTMYLTCSPEAWKLVKQQITKQYPGVCLFGQYDFD